MRTDMRPILANVCGCRYGLAAMSTSSAPQRNIVVFDLRGVLIDWNPRHLYRKLFAGDDAAMERFLSTVCTHEWNRCQDAGRSFAEGARLLKAGAGITPSGRPAGRRPAQPRQ